MNNVAVCRVSNRQNFAGLHRFDGKGVISYRSDPHDPVSHDTKIAHGLIEHECSRLSDSKLNRVSRGGLLRRLSVCDAEIRTALVEIGGA